MGDVISGMGLSSLLMPHLKCKLYQTPKGLRASSPLDSWLCSMTSLFFCSSVVFIFALNLLHLGVVLHKEYLLHLCD